VNNNILISTLYNNIDIKNKKYLEISQGKLHHDGVNMDVNSNYNTPESY